jgi:hypothetical protein
LDDAINKALKEAMMAKNTGTGTRGGGGKITIRTGGGGATKGGGGKISIKTN